MLNIEKYKDEIIKEYQSLLKKAVIGSRKEISECSYQTL